MNIKIFVDRRKELGLSQAELCENICTQTTLSRFENQGQIPSIKILIRLCKRLDISVGDLFPANDGQNVEIDKKLEKAEFAFITSEFKEATEILASIEEKQLTTDHTKWRYIYLKGFLATLQKSPLSDSFFYLNQLITDYSHTEDNIYVRLAYTGLGLAYANASEFDRAEYYIDKAQHQLQHFPITSTEDVWRILNIIYHCGEFHAQVGDFQTSNQLLSLGINLCSEHHITYYLARMQFRLAQNAFAENKPLAVITETTQDAKAFAKINHNEILLREIALFQEKLQQTATIK